MVFPNGYFKISDASALRPPVPELRITHHAEAGYNVHLGDQNAGGRLTCGEVLELVIFHMALAGRNYPLETDQGWKERAARVASKVEGAQP